ncbi:hypothetical protein DPEC_G00241860 [Dallia pectoralis]|uniref:Uncharacterized protein n=1 Tax=Dallia pectoralis TaxID=75939 RepID=A0ACC2FV34_DALPE|nr:hypothetical protein DPEC_G00241860 [Dallia pectoralis]
MGQHPTPAGDHFDVYLTAERRTNQSKGQMNGATFPSPTAEMAEMNRIHYELEYTEGISQRMRIPEMLKMGHYSSDNPEAGSHDYHNTMMQVPERIVMTGDSEDSQYPRPRDLDLIQSTPLESLSLKTPPRVLTLNERPLDFMEMESSAAPAPPSEEMRSHGRLRRERSASENATLRHNSQMARNDSSFALATLDSTVDVSMAPDDMAVVDAATLRRQIIKLNRRLQLIEEENKERAKREMLMYSAIIINTNGIGLWNVLLTQTREKKRWMKAYTLLMERKLKVEGPPPPKPRSQKLNWDYHAEVQAFSSRLQETFSLELLKTAFVNPCYIQTEQERRQAVGVDSEAAALILLDNVNLHKQGQEFTKSFLFDWYRASFPSLPSEGVAAIVGHLNSLPVMCHVARNLAIDDLTMSAKFPVPDNVLHSTFLAVIGALHESSGPEKAGLFLRDFLVTQMIGKDLFEVWSVVNPMGLLVDEMSKRNMALPEPRLTRSSGAATVLPVYFVGLYSDKKLLADAPGVTVLAAEEEAARVALRKLYGYTDNRRPWDFSVVQQPPALQSISSG